MKYAVAILVCVVSLGAVTGAEAAMPAGSRAEFKTLSELAAADLGEHRLACLAPVWETQPGHRTTVKGKGSPEGSPIVGFDLLVTAHRALPLARRLRRAHEGIVAVEVVGERYSLTSMRHLEQVTHKAMAAYPSAGVSYLPFETPEESEIWGPQGDGPTEPPCPKIEVLLDGMPQEVMPGGPPPSPEPGESKAAATKLMSQYGRMRLISLE
jgi:hypothetical protein